MQYLKSDTLYAGKLRGAVLALPMFLPAGEGVYALPARTGRLVTAVKTPKWTALYSRPVPLDIHNIRWEADSLYTTVPVFLDPRTRLTILDVPAYLMSWVKDAVTSVAMKSLRIRPPDDFYRDKIFSPATTTQSLHLDHVNVANSSELSVLPAESIIFDHATVAYMPDLGHFMPSPMTHTVRFLGCVGTFVGRYPHSLGYQDIAITLPESLPDVKRLRFINCALDGKVRIAQGMQVHLERCTGVATFSGPLSKVLVKSCDDAELFFNPTDRKSELMLVNQSTDVIGAFYSRDRIFK